MSKKITYLFYSLFLIVPGTALAQFSPPIGNSTNYDMSSLSSTTSNFLFWILGGIALLSFIGLIIAGIDIVIASSDEDRIRRGKGTLVMSIIGLLVSIIGIIILYYAMQYLGE